MTATTTITHNPSLELEGRHSVQDVEAMPSGAARTRALRDRAILALLEARMSCATLLALKVNDVLDDSPLPNHPDAERIMWFIECYLDELPWIYPEAPLFVSGGRALTATQLERIQAHSLTVPTSVGRTYAVRDLAICALLEARMSCATLLALKVRDILAGSPLPNHPDSERIMYLIESYLDELPCIEPEALLFASNGRPLTVRQLQRIRAQSCDW